MKVFPRWMEALGRTDVGIRGIDHPLHDEPSGYRRTVERIRDDPAALGALVTTHKIDLYEAAHDLFDELHPSAELTGEISCISKKEGKLVGHAKDPLTSGLSLSAILEDGYFERTGGHVLNFGAGGTGKAIALHLLTRPCPVDRPARFVMVNRSRDRLDTVRDMVARVGGDIEFEYVCNEDPAQNDALMAALPPGSVVVNSTGMGKDRPGSPVTDDGLFPRDGAVWEVNYRGSLDFWHQARWQRDERNLTVEDGWLYFVHGWTQHIAEGLGIPLHADTFATLEALAADLRPPLEERPR
jgi:shikimate 5-dehydrogenase